MRGRERGDHDKLERLEVCTENLVKRLQLDHDKVKLIKPFPAFPLQRIVIAVNNVSLHLPCLKLVGHTSKDVHTIMGSRPWKVSVSSWPFSVLSRAGTSDDKLISSFW